jgi:hypothetical protein
LGILAGVRTPARAQGKSYRPCTAYFSRKSYTMNNNRALERAILAEIAYLQAELERIRASAPAAAADAGEPVALVGRQDDDYMSWALQDEGFRTWLLRQQLEVR